MGFFDWMMGKDKPTPKAKKRVCPGCGQKNALAYDQCVGCGRALPRGKAAKARKAALERELAEEKADDQARHKKVREQIAEPGPDAGDQESTIDGIHVPQGEFTQGLAARDSAIFNETIDAISELAKNGRRDGLDELEAIIQANIPSWAALQRFADKEDYEAALSDDAFTRKMALDASDRKKDVEKQIAKLVNAARKRGLLGDISKAQTTICVLNLGGRLKQARDEVKKAAGEAEGRYVDFLYSQMVINARYLDAGSHA